MDKELKMGFDKYVHHISQKYRIAVAISVIKSKPGNVSIEEYLIQLQNKIRDMETDPNETVCSDDFNFDDDDIWNEKQPDTQMQCTETDMVNENRVNCSVEGNDSQGSQTILNDFVINDACIAQRDNSLVDTIRLLKEVSTVQAQPDDDQMFSQLTFCESQENPDNITNSYSKSNKIIVDNYEHPKNIVANNNMDSQETQLYTLYGFTQDYSHVSQTQDEYFIIPDKYIRNNANNVIQDNVNEVNEDRQRFSVSQNVPVENKMHGKESERIEKPMNENLMTVNVENNLRNTQLQYNYHNDTKITHKTGVVSGDIIDITNNVMKEIETFQNDIANSLDTNEDKHGINKTTNNNTYANMTETYVTNTNVKETNANNTFDSQKEFINNSIKNQNYTQDSQCNSDINKKITKINNTDDVQHELDGNFEVAMDIDETESDENVQERVPFKVVEELSRVKTYLNRKDRKYDGCSTDSGYRSDSQHRNSLRSSSQPSGGWLNQSAHCLYSHIMQATPTDDIVKEISQVLGKLIDKLHEEENYPPFLEELLETVDRMLRDIHTDGCTDNLILNKDEKIQRMILVNKSKHILKYSIEKITAILQQLHTNLTQENPYECTNIVDLENICYIFHMLEIFLKRYKKVKDSNQSQNSQDTLPKRSSLAELWRKKWNPNSKEIVKHENKICVLKGCSEILNKIIVECMNGYSLVSYAALQCFNLIQD